MKISACTIVKNEAANLPGWLANMAQVADEMIVVDTGSTDDSTAIAKAAGAKVCDFQWCDDFSAAKNFAIDQAQGEWIIFLDADEWFTPDSIGRVRQVIQQKARDKKVAVLLCQLINIDLDKNNKVIDSMLQARIFRKLPSIRYAGKIHEHLTNTAQMLKMVYTMDLQIYHSGYSSSIMLSKAKRNLPLLLQQQAEAKTTAEREKLLPFLMDVYNTLGEYSLAIEYARRSIEADVQQLGMGGHFYEVIISALQMGQYPREELYSTLAEAMEKYPDEPSFAIEKGFFLWQDKDYLQAEKYLQQGIAAHEAIVARQQQGEGITDSSLHVLPQLYEALGDIFEKKRNFPKAVELYTEGLKIQKYAPALTRGFYRCLQSLTPVDKIQALQSFYQRQQDADYLISALTGVWEKQVAAYYGVCGAGHAKSELYLQLERFDSAAIEAAAKIHRYGKLLAAKVLLSGETNFSLPLQVLLPEAYSQAIRYEDKQQADALHSKALKRLVQQISNRR